jgi:osmotically inducible protein OsmC
LIGAAHAACFSMALASLLAQAGNPADSIQDERRGDAPPRRRPPTITQIDLVTVGRVPGIDDAKFQEQAAAAKAGCR